MPGTSSKGPRSPRAVDHRRLIHVLNQRYYREWLRAERLERDLARARSSWYGPLIAWVRHLKRRLVPGSSRRPSPTIPSRQTLVERPGPLAGKVSIVIPFRDRVELLRDCLRSLKGSTYRDFEVLLVDNDSCEPNTLRYLARLASRKRVRVLERPGPFNFSWLCNQGAACARGDYLLFLNDDTAILTPDWLERMLGLAARQDVGVTGATLLYPDDTIQHAGLFPLPDGRWTHAGSGEAWRPEGEPRVVPAVTGACLLVRRDTFTDLGGFDERLPITYGDVDLCLRARARGLLVAVTPHARLLHYEGLTRGFSDDRPGSAHLAALSDFPTDR